MTFLSKLGLAAAMVAGSVTAASAFTACQVTDTGGIDDAGFNQTAWKGVEDAMAANGIERGFMNAASPGVISLFLQNDFYPTRDAYLAALADAMRQCINDPALRERLGKQAAQDIAAFSPQRVLRQWDAALAEALAPHTQIPHEPTRNTKETAA